MSADLLLEVGCEEIPAKFVTKALAELPEMVTARLAAARLSHHGVTALGTPRRLAVLVRGLSDRQPDLREDVVGPPVGAAFAPDGSPTKAGLGFAQKNGVDPQTLQRREVAGKKGLYAIAERHVEGQPTRALLPTLLTELVAGIAWPKSMRWGWGETAFVRPVQWLLALYGDEVVPFSWGGMTAGRQSRGHRFLAPGAVDLATPDGYQEALRRAFVIVDPEARRNTVRGELSRIERASELRVRPDEALIAEVAQLGEYPVGICGQFDPSFLEVPEEVIVTAMRTHQRYFAMEDASGKLAPRFVTMMATVVKDPAVVEAGNQRVLAARLSDAKFFFAEDQKKPLEEWGRKLESVVFQAKLGDAEKTVGRKMERIVALASALAERVPGCDAKVVARAAQLCKCDLATGSVGEFPELQGVMGMHYARKQDEPEGVALAIAEHYLPKGQGSAVPSTIEGAIVALADRLDTLVGCFLKDIQPTGSADPFGLRRASIGVLQILMKWGQGGELAGSGSSISVPLSQLLDFAYQQFGEEFKQSVTAALKASPTASGLESLRAFLQARLRILFMDEGIAPIDAHAVVTRENSMRTSPARLLECAREVAKVPEAARQVFKRIANILDDADYSGDGEVRVELFDSKSGVESKLWETYKKLRIAEVADPDNQDYAASFTKLRELGPAVAAFFDKGGVMVMDPDPKLRDNRLALLQRIRAPYQQIVDFRLLGASA